MPHPDIRAVLISFWSGHMVQTEVRRRLLFHLSSFFFFLVFLLRSIIIVLYLWTSDSKILQHRHSRKESRETGYCTRTRLSTTTLGTEALLMIGSVVDAYYMYLDWVPQS